MYSEQGGGNTYIQNGNPGSDTAIAEKVLRRWKQADSERMPWVSFWQQLADYVRPSRDQIQRSNKAPTLWQFENLFDGTAISANMTLASGCMARLTPAQTPWFSFDPPGPVANDDAVKRWFSECSEIALEALASSNFYTELHELYLDRGAFGTACLHVEGSDKHPLIFKSEDVGTFALLNGADGIADTVFRQRMLSAREATQEYGEKNLPDELCQELKNQTPSEAKHEFLHAIYPREDAERDGMKLDAVNMPIASIHIHVKTRRVVRKSGYQEMPSLGSRYLRWGTHAYGICPAWQALPDCRQVNELQKNLDVLAEVAAFPRMLVPDDMAGEIDLRANGVTFFKDPQKIPREWGTQGRFDIGMERVKERQEAIKRAFHVELFNMWSALTKQMTASEVNSREAEKIELFSPTFTLLTTEVFNPLLRRVFALLLRQGVFPQPPEQAVYINARGRYAIPDPEIRYTSRLALALKAVRNLAFNRTMERIAPLMQFRPDIADNIDFDRAVRDGAIDDGMPVDWLKDEEDVANMRKARAEQAAQQQQEIQAHQMADTAAKVSKSGLLEKMAGGQPEQEAA